MNMDLIQLTKTAFNRTRYNISQLLLKSSSIKPLYSSLPAAWMDRTETGPFCSHGVLLSEGSQLNYLFVTKKEKCHFTINSKKSQVPDHWMSPLSLTMDEYMLSPVLLQTCTKLSIILCNGLCFSEFHFLYKMVSIEYKITVVI